MGFASLAVDLGHAYYVGQKAQNAADAAALAGSIYLPSDLATAQSTARDLAAENGFTNGEDGVTVSANQGADASELNVTVNRDVPTWFARVIGFNMMNVSKSATAIATQPSTTPYDLVLILDRTGSMSPPDLAKVKAATKALLGVLDPKFDHVALGTLGPSSTTDVCTANGTTGAIGIAQPVSGGSWMAAPFPLAAPLDDYQDASGVANPASQIVKSVDCLNTSSVMTNLGDPIQAAQNYLATYGRPEAQKGIILMTDGEANTPTPTSCQYAIDHAAAAKAAGINLATIGFGVEAAHCVDTAGTTYDNADVTTVLADMASPTNGVAAKDDLGCTDAENEDGDNFFCEPKSGDLSKVFVAAAAQMTQANPRLIK